MADTNNETDEANESKQSSNASNCCIYMLTSPSGKSYVGQTEGSYLVRWKKHVNSAKRGDDSHGCPLLNNAIRKYGANHFKVKVIKTCTKDELDNYETHYIKKYHTLKPNGYNIQEGGKGNHITGVEQIDDGKKLPKYIYRLKNHTSGQVIGYAVRKHPNQNGHESIYIDKTKTMPQKLKSAQKYIENLDKLKKPLEKHTRTLPKYIEKYKNGYKVFYPNKKASGVAFTKKHHDNLADAVEYLNKLQQDPKYKRKTLPKYITEYKEVKTGEYIGYKVYGHPIQEGKARAFLSREHTLSENLELAKKYLAELNNGEIPQKKDLPKYLNNFLSRKTKEHVGYVVRGHPNQNGAQRRFTTEGKVKSLEENLKLAKKYLKQLDAGKNPSKKKLPMYITEHKNRKTKEINGYKVRGHPNQNGKMRSFTDKSMEENLEDAKSYLKLIEGGKDKPKRELPMYLREYKDRKTGEITGYMIKGHPMQGGTRSKIFSHPDQTMEEKFKKAKKYLDSLNEQNDKEDEEDNEPKVRRHNKKKHDDDDEAEIRHRRED